MNLSTAILFIPRNCDTAVRFDECMRGNRNSILSPAERARSFGPWETEPLNRNQVHRL